MKISIKSRNGIILVTVICLVCTILGILGYDERGGEKESVTITSLASCDIEITDVNTNLLTITYLASFGDTPEVALYINEDGIFVAKYDPNKIDEAAKILFEEVRLIVNEYIKERMDVLTFEVRDDELLELGKLPVIEQNPHRME